VAAAGLLPPTAGALLQEGIDVVAILIALQAVRAVADGVGPGRDLAPVRELLTRLEEQLLPLERAEERLLYPVMARLLGGDDPTGAMSRAHAEIEHQVGRLRRVLADLAQGTPADVTDALELQRLLHGLYAVVRLHNAHEDEGMFSLVPGVPPAEVAGQLKVDPDTRGRPLPR
jgi:hypothetical protein